MENDTLLLLKECDSGVKMAINAFNDVIDEIQNPNIIEIMRESKTEHTELGNDVRKLLHQYGEESPDPSPMARGMSHLMTEMKLAIDSTDAKICDIVTDGCNMGIKSLNKYLNKYKASDSSAREITQKLIDLEEKLNHRLYPFL